uniref:uncharacterized protein LOC122597324 n=1 Tax=Erigeron canadensis TaxID=72917 RepID=UPI001CB94A38|nr:uncharacterized protein LOC122597324 [Erigeron canadensis]
MWLVSLDRLPTRNNLAYKGMDMPSIRCPLCDNFVETCDHVFDSCEFASYVRAGVSNWLQIVLLALHGPAELLHLVDTMQISMEKKRVVEAIVFCGCWSIWKFRNDKVFNKGKQRKEYIIDNIIVYSYLWLSNRTKKKYMSLVEWLSIPLSFV